MLRVLPALEAYAIANIATQNLVGGNPLQFLLGDLNTTPGTGFGAVMGPQPGVLTLKELLTGEYNAGTSTIAGTSTSMVMNPTSGYGGTSIVTGSTAAGTPLEILTANFSANFGNIVVGSVLTTAGFRIANKVLAKPKNKMNAMIRKVGLGSTIQI
jgi:hypothetical protein